MAFTQSHPLPLAAVRALALYAQRLTASNNADSVPTLDTIYDTVVQLGCLQVDTLHMVRRSHYVTLWSRLGGLVPADLDRLIYDPEHRRLFEYWMHAASIIPLCNYRYRLPMMDHHRESGGWWPDWIKKPENQAVVRHVRERIQTEGALRSADFKHDGAKRGSWWDWKPSKHALEYLYNVGEVMIAERVNFQRVYNLRERVLPKWIDMTPPTDDDTDRFVIERAARALGIGAAGHIADYAYRKRGTAAPVIKALVAEGVLVEVEGEVHGGDTATLITHRDHLPALEQAADGAIVPQRTTFLNPFDSLFWPRDRDQQVWGFRQTLEAYRKAEDRIWGYYCLPILHHDRLVGRFDPKLDRKTSTLILRALYLEPGIVPDEALIADVAATMRDFMAWHEATDLVIEKSDPAAFGEKLLAAAL